MIMRWLINPPRMCVCVSVCACVCIGASGLSVSRLCTILLCTIKPDMNHVLKSTKICLLQFPAPRASPSYLLLKREVSAPAHSLSHSSIPKHSRTARILPPTFSADSFQDTRAASLLPTTIIRPRIFAALACLAPHSSRPHPVSTLQPGILLNAYLPHPSST